MINGFTAESEKHRKYVRVTEDSLAFDKTKRAIAVADGVTRDPLEVLPDTRREAGKLEFMRNYPRISPAKLAADIFTSNFVKYAWQSHESVMVAFEKANQIIKRWNGMHMKNHDYLTRDLAGCVAAGAVIERGNYFYGFICDCGFAVFGKEGNIKMITGDEGPSFHDKAIWATPIMQGLEWKMPQARKNIRSLFRNNLHNSHSFGVLTGEETALGYVKTGNGRLKQGDTVIVYSDDARPIITSKEFADKVKARDFSGIEQLMQEQVKNEGTLVYYVHE